MGLDAIAAQLSVAVDATGSGANTFDMGLPKATKSGYGVTGVLRIMPLLCLLAWMASGAARSQKSPVATLPNTSLIIPGKSVGPLVLGASRDTVEQIFPFKTNMDQEDMYPTCGSLTEINWLDFNGNTMSGNVFIYLHGRQVFQIASATPRFSTADGIRAGTLPELVRKRFTGLDAYVLHPSGGQMYDFRDFIYWISGDKGIAFELAYNRRDRSRLVSKVIVFQPTTEFAPNGCIFPPQEWHKISPYSLGDVESGPVR